MSQPSAPGGLLVPAAQGVHTSAVLAAPPMGRKVPAAQGAHTPLRLYSPGPQ